MRQDFAHIMYRVQEWAIERGLDKADHHAQLVKLMEEVGELSEAVLKFGPVEIEDAIGDILVVLTVLSLQLDVDDIDDCYNSAYQVIKNRKGKLVNGIYIKEEDMH